MFPVSFQTLLAAARLRADMSLDQSITDPQFLTLINDSASELYDELIEADCAYNLRQYIFTAVPQQDTYPLRNDFYIEKGVDAQMDGIRWVTVRPFQFRERNRYAWGLVVSPLGVSPYGVSFQYEIENNSIRFIPSQIISQLPIRVWYYPTLPPMLNSVQATALVGSFVAGQGVLATALLGGPVTLTINLSLGSPFSVTYSGGTLTVVTPSTDTISILCDRLNQAFAAPIGPSQPPLMLFTPQGDPNGLLASGGVALSGGSGSPGVCSIDVIANGWGDLITTDVAIKVGDIQDKDVTVLVAQKSALMKRILGRAKRRSATEPKRGTSSLRGPGSMFGRIP